MISRVYLAAWMNRREEMREYRRALEKLNIVVTSRWLDPSHSAGIPPTPDSMTNNPLLFARYAAIDLQDIATADTVIFFSEDDGGKSSGGRHTELGFAIGLGRNIILIGKRENVFQCLPSVVHCSNWSSFEEYLAYVRDEENYGIQRRH